MSSMRTSNIAPPTNGLYEQLDLGGFGYPEDEQLSPAEKVDRDSKIVETAAKLNLMGEDHTEYLAEHGVVAKRIGSKIWESTPEMESLL